MTIYVTDHAVLRYIERIHGMNVETLREELKQRALRAAEAADRVGASNYVINSNGVRMRVVGGHVVTVLTPKEKA